MDEYYKVNFTSILNVMKSIQLMKGNMYQSFIKSTWIRSYIDDLHMSGMITKDECEILQGVYNED